MKETIIIFGFSNIGMLLYEAKKVSFDGRVLFCDNSTAKQESAKKDSIVVLPVSEAVQKYPNAKYVLASLYHIRQMKEQLIELGVDEKQIEEKIPDEIIEQEKKRISDQAASIKKGFQFEVSITKECNLNCRGCDHFAPLANGETFAYELGQYRKDIKRMSELFNGSVDRISILGGEPLLNDLLLEYLIATREEFPIGDIRIITNGILLEKQDDLFWEICKTRNIIISVTKYPIKLNYERLKKLTVDKGCQYEYCGVSEATRTFWHEPLDLGGNQNGEANFHKCTFGNACIVLDHGKMFSCIIPANIELFNHYFGKNLELTRDDYIDIYQVKDKEELLLKLSKPFPFCRYCDIDHRSYDHEFEISKRRIEEWTL